VAAGIAGTGYAMFNFGIEHTILSSALAAAGGSASLNLATNFCSFFATNNAKTAVNSTALNDPETAPLISSLSPV
jgi:hypothetical protein